MTTEQKRARARHLRDHHSKSIREIAEELGVSKNTAHRYVNPEAEQRQFARCAANKRRRRREEKENAES